MKVDEKTRMVKLVVVLYAGVEVNWRYICETFGVSRATASRDLVALEQGMPLRCRLDDRGGMCAPRPEKFLSLPREMVRA